MRMEAGGSGSRAVVTLLPNRVGLASLPAECIETYCAPLLSLLLPPDSYGVEEDASEGGRFLALTRTEKELSIITDITAIDDIIENASRLEVSRPDEERSLTLSQSKLNTWPGVWRPLRIDEGHTGSGA